MDSTDMFAEKRRELGEVRAKVEREIAALRERLAEIDLELGAIAAYDEYMARDARSLEPRVDASVKGGRVTREAILDVIAGATGRGIGRGEIIDALGIKGNRTGENAVDNRLRELKRERSVLHEGRVYRVPN